MTSRSPLQSSLLFLIVALGPVTPAISAVVPLKIEVHLDNSRPLSQDLYGANNECIFRPVWFDHPAYGERYIAAGRPFFRFPGGTGSNFYNPVTGYFDDDSPSTRDYSGHNRRIKQYSGGKGRTPDQWFKWVKQHEVRYSLVLNVCTQTFEQNRAWIEKLGRDGHSIARIEIGNEVFFGSYKWAFPTAADYATRARKLTAVIRKSLPDTRIGVVIPNQIYQDDRLLANDRPRHLNHPHEWISKLKGETLYDAVVLHPYSPTGMSNDTKPADFIPHLEGYNQCDAHLDRSMDRTLENLEHLFPGKSIWMTEFGVGGFGGNLKQYTLRYSHLGALHADVMWLRFIKRASINVAHWHSFQHFFDFPGGEKGIGDKEHLPYTHFSLFRDAIRGSNEVVPLKVSSDGNPAACAAIEAAAIAGKGRGYVVLINRHGQDFSLHPIVAISSGKETHLTLVSGLQLKHRSDMPLSDAMQDTERCDRLELPVSEQKPITLPPYSMTRLEFARP